ncbi:uncharacterized protein LOC126985530 [Eriocheir sinensis]|uniref:uncharacterized protein LOC126985530 n=1 Tax=Eriocheir sinensis TaxID=95602 RepID=UPI0021C718A3|nr:uncharacterized protein LOC126985530 [Eriocheir sinensis]
MVRWAAVVVAWACLGAEGVLGACTVAEFPCKNRQCVRLDRYCDGHPDCDDGSDEPPSCTPCNRTYYGRMGSTYTLQVHRPHETSLPHFCQLTFIASRDLYGDLVQLSIEKFSVGRFMSHTKEGCPDGHMQIEELSRPQNSGFWCGTSWGHNVYYSETTAVTLMLRVFNLTSLPQDRQNPATFQPQDTVMLRLSYRFLRKERAVLRYGPPYKTSYRGEDLSNSFCDKYFENCDKRNCKIQSPNFPGMYPRNLTCFYRVRQTHVPEGKVALVSVLQRNPHLIYIKDRNAPHLSREQRLEVGATCHEIHDYLVVYDGDTTRAPVLAKVCKGGTQLSRVTASGSEMLLLFRVSPFDFPFQDSPRRHIFGFELDVEVEFVEKESTAYVRRGGECEYEKKSSGQRSGYVQAAAHSLLANTTCTWRLRAGPSEVVWLYFLHFRHVQHPEMPRPAQCPNTLTIYSGTGPPATTLNGAPANDSLLLGQFCKPDKLPRVCGGVHAPGPYSAPCAPHDSYVSTLPAMTLTLRYAAGTTPSHVEFLARYEFVDTRQWGDPAPGGGPCDRVFNVRPDRLFASPRDVFLFGRGGSRRLRCVYTFEVGPRQRVSLRLLRARMGPSCSTMYRNASRRHECSHGGAAGQPSITLEEEPWPGVPLQRACLCNVSHGRPFSLVSYTGRLKLTFSVPDMTPAQDYNHFYFEGEYSVVAEPPEVTRSCNQSARLLHGAFGNFTVGAGRGDLCASLPRLIRAADASFLFMRVRGFEASLDNCRVASRINVFAAGGVTPLASVCPERRDVFTNIFSSGWDHFDFRFQDQDLFWGNLTLGAAATTTATTAVLTTTGDEFGSTGTGLTTPTTSTTTTATTTTTTPTTTSTSTTTFSSLPGLAASPTPTTTTETPLRLQSRDLLVEYVGNYSGSFLVTWVSLWRPLRAEALVSVAADPCPHGCYDIGACLPQELWCDGIPHCPTGQDEGATACGLLTALPWVYMAALSVLLLSMVALFVAVVAHKRQVYMQKAVAEAAAAAINNGTSLKGGTDLLLPPADTW